MSLTKRSRIVLSSREHKVLIDLLKGLDVDASTEHLCIARTSVVHARRRLQKKFGAQSVVHMMVLAILEKKYFNVLYEGPDKYSDSLNGREVYIAQQILLGIRNKRIAEMSYLSVRTIEDYRDSFNKKCSVKSSRDFVKACLDNGILKIIPFEFEFFKAEEETQPFESFDTSIEHFQILPNHSHVNPYGFTYFDFQNRFVAFESETILLYSRINVSPLTLSLILSDISLDVIERVTGLPIAFLNARCAEIESQVIQYGGCMSFFQLLHELNFFHPVVHPKETEEILILGKKIILQAIDQKPMQFCEQEKKQGIVNDNERSLLKRQFNCTSDLAVIIQAIHLGMIQLGIST